MSRYRAIWDNFGKAAEFEDGVCVWARDDKPKGTKNVHVIRDLEPYQSMITGEVIDGRAQHRDHLNRHGCIEVGNETMRSNPVQAPVRRREVLHRQLADMSDRQANKILRELRRS